MSLRDDLESVIMEQTSEYKESAPSSQLDDVNELNSKIYEDTEVLKNNRKKRESPFTKKDENGVSVGKGKIIIICIIVLIFICAIVFGIRMMTYDKGAGFYQEMEEGEVALFEYTMDERETLRINGYTADDIERYEAEERDPYTLVQEAEEARQKKYEEEIKPYLDGASDKYKQLESMTWLGTGEMSEIVLNSPVGSYEERYGTYNCDYIKIPPMGSQLFIKLELFEFNTDVFMTLNAERYNQLSDSGNIVIVMEYNKYSDGSILVTNIQEKDIKS